MRTGSVIWAIEFVGRLQSRIYGTMLYQRH